MYTHFFFFFFARVWLECFSLMYTMPSIVYNVGNARELCIGPTAVIRQNVRLAWIIVNGAMSHIIFLRIHDNYINMPSRIHDQCTVGGLAPGSTSTFTLVRNLSLNNHPNKATSSEMVRISVFWLNVIASGPADGSVLPTSSRHSSGSSVTTPSTRFRMHH